jgi:hypothetical protein
VGIFWRSSIVGTSGLILPLTASRPVPFNVDITPRFPEAAALLAAENEIENH